MLIFLLAFDNVDSWLMLARFRRLSSSGSRQFCTSRNLVSRVKKIEISFLEIQGKMDVFWHENVVKVHNFLEKNMKHLFEIPKKIYRDSLLTRKPNTRIGHVNDSGNVIWIVICPHASRNVFANFLFPNCKFKSVDTNQEDCITYWCNFVNFSFG